MADTIQADLALRRAQDAAASKVIALQAQKAAEAAAAETRAAIETLTALNVDIALRERNVTLLSQQVRNDLAAVGAIKLQLAGMLDQLAADQVAYDDSVTDLGAATVAAAIVRLAQLIADLGGVQVGQLNFADPDQSGLLPAI